VANTIGGLSIEVSADIAKLVVNLEQAQRHNTEYARRMQETMQRAADSVKDAFKDIAGALGVAFSVEKIVEFGRAAFEQAEKISRLSQSLGVTTQTLQTMSYAAGLTGSSMDDVATAMARLEKASVQAAAGNKQLSAVFDAIGVSVRDATGHIKPADQLIVEVSKHLSQFQDGAEKTAAAMLLMGRGAAQNIPLINELGNHFEELKKRAEELGLVLSDGDQKALDEAQRGFNEFGQQLKGIGNILALEFAPDLKRVQEALRDFLTNGDPKGKIHDIANAFRTLGDVMNFVWALFKSGAQVLAGAMAAIQTFNEYVTSSAQRMGTAVKAEFAVMKDVVTLHWKDAMDKVAQAQADAYSKSQTATKGLIGSLKEIGHSLAVDVASNFGVASSAGGKFANVISGSSTVVAEAVKKHLNLVDALSKESAASKKWAEDLQKLQTLQANLTSGLQGPEQAALEKYNKQIEEIRRRTRTPMTPAS
jgi:methyl-accepting chemotaxis protein